MSALTSRVRIRSRLLAAGIFVLAFAAIAAPAPADEALDARWSAKLLEHKAEIERAQQELDERRADYARAVAAGQPAVRVAALRAAREVAETALREREEALPALLAEAREAGVSPEVLAPYRYATAPVEASGAGTTPPADR